MSYYAKIEDNTGYVHHVPPARDGEKHVHTLSAMCKCRPTVDTLNSDIVHFEFKEEKEEGAKIYDAD